MLGLLQSGASRAKGASAKSDLDNGTDRPYRREISGDYLINKKDAIKGQLETRRLRQPSALQTGEF